MDHHELSYVHNQTPTLFHGFILNFIRYIDNVVTSSSTSLGEHQLLMGSVWCRAHAADVLQSTHAILHGSEVLRGNFIDEREVLACYLAAMVHDAEHPGAHA